MYNYVRLSFPNSTVQDLSKGFALVLSPLLFTVAPEILKSRKTEDDDVSLQNKKKQIVEQIMERRFFILPQNFVLLNIDSIFFREEL